MGEVFVVFGAVEVIVGVGATLSIVTESGMPVVTLPAPSVWRAV